MIKLETIIPHTITEVKNITTSEGDEYYIVILNTHLSIEDIFSLQDEIYSKYKIDVEIQVNKR
jgi:hypothetical protein